MLDFGTILWLVAGFASVFAAARAGGRPTRSHS